MTEESNREIVWSIGLALSAALHAGGLYYLASHAKTPGATDVPTAAISVSLVPTKVLESLAETGAVETAGSGTIGQGGQSAPLSETEPPEQEAPKPDPQAEESERRRAEAEAREKAEAEARERTETEARVKAEAETLAKADAEARTLAEAREKAEMEARAKAEAEADARDKAEARAEAEERQRADTEQRERAEAERRKLAEAQRRKEAEEQQARERTEEEHERRAEAEKRKKQREARAAGNLSSGQSQNPSQSQTGKVSASTGALLNYQARVHAQVARNKPRSGAASGRVVFSIRLSESGELTDARILRSSGNAGLDQAALAAARRAAPYPSAPRGSRPGDRLFHIPFNFK